MKKVGVFSGTFDPFHVAHLEVCLVAKSVCGLQTVAIMTEHKPVRKQKVTDYKHRLQMIDLSIQAYPSLRLIDPEVDNITAKSAAKVLREQFPVSEFWYIFGSDMLTHIPDWSELDVLINEFKFCVVLRHNEEKEEVLTSLKKLKKKFPKLEYKVLPAVWSPLSASQIRHTLKETGYSDHVHRDVITYSHKHHIY